MVKIDADYRGRWEKNMDINMGNRGPILPFGDYNNSHTEEIKSDYKVIK